jgi:AcrR family transcriptional regulator
MSVAGQSYRLGRRQASVDRTAGSILAAARELVASGSAASVGEIARRAGVSRITVYNRFGSRAAVIQALAPHEDKPIELDGDPRELLRRRLAEACSRWSTDPSLFRHLPPGISAGGSAPNRELAERLAAADQLRPGCSIKEAEDVIGALASFEVFDRLHRDGRRTAAAVGEILWRLAGGILA